MSGRALRHTLALGWSFAKAGTAAHAVQGLGRAANGLLCLLMQQLHLLWVDDLSGRHAAVWQSSGFTTYVFHQAAT